MATIVLKLGDRELQTIGITAIRTFIGRDPGCDLTIDNEGISRRHARIEFRGGSFTLIDNGSANGVHVGGRRVDSVELMHGTKVTLGKFTVVFLDMGGMPLEQLRNILPDEQDVDIGPTQHLDENYMRKMRAALEERERDQGGLGTTRPVTRPVTVRQAPPKKSGGVGLMLLGVAIGAAAVVVGLILWRKFGG